MATSAEHFSALPEIAIRPMSEADVAPVVAIELASYRFPWSEGIFRDCLKVGYICRVVVVYDAPFSGAAPQASSPVRSVAKCRMRCTVARSRACASA